MFLDSNMPLMNGLECGKAIRHFESMNYKIQTTYIVSLSADETANSHEYLAAGFNSTGKY